MALLLVVTLAACTDEPTDPSPSPTVSPQADGEPTPSGEAEDDGLVVVTPGDRPRSVLTATTPLEDTVAVTATSSLAAEGDGGAQEVTASYDLAVVLSPGEESMALSATPTLRTTDVAGPPPQALGSFRWTLDEGGTILDMAAEGFDVPVQPQLRRLLSFSHLVLEAPEVAVGAGAEWYREVDGARISVIIDRLDDTAVTGTVTTVADTDGGTLETRSVGTWQTDTLLALDVVTTSTATASRDVVVDGEQVTLVVTQRDRRELTRGGS